MSRYDPVLMGQCHGLPVPYIAAGVNVALLSYFQVKGISEKKYNKKKPPKVVLQQVMFLSVWCITSISAQK